QNTINMSSAVISTSSTLLPQRLYNVLASKESRLVINTLLSDSPILTNLYHAFLDILSAPSEVDSTAVRHVAALHHIIDTMVQLGAYQKFDFLFINSLDEFPTIALADLHPTYADLIRATYNDHSGWAMAENYGPIMPIHIPFLLSNSGVSH